MGQAADERGPSDLMRASSPEIGGAVCRNRRSAAGPVIAQERDDRRAFEGWVCTMDLALRLVQRLDRPWGGTLIGDQYLGASLGWSLGDYPLAILAGVLVSLWVKADHRERESRRFDRNEDRSGDAELTGYNDYLARLATSRDPEG